MKLTPEQIARVCYAANKELNDQIGEETLPIEIALPSTTKGVELALSDPNLTPAASHESWCDEKYGSGWVYGPTKNAVTKEHPCLVEYDQLPAEQRVKDSLFIAIVHALKS